MMMMMLRCKTTRDKLLKNLVARFHSKGILEGKTAAEFEAEYTRKMYEELLQSRPLPPLKRFNRLLGRFVECDLHPAIISLNKQMVLHGIARDGYTLSTLVSSYCYLNQLGFGLSFMGNLVKMGLQADPMALESLIHCFLLEKKVPEALEIFTKLLRGEHRKPSIFAFQRLIKGLGINRPIMYQCIHAVLDDREVQNDMLDFLHVWTKLRANQVPKTCKEL